MITKVINNFTGALTRQNTGELNSGLAKYDQSFGYNPFTNPTNLTWFEQPSSILDGAGNAMAAARTRLEGRTTFVYTVTNDLQLRKIAANDASNYVADYNSPSIIGALLQSPTGSTLSVLYGSSMQFYGATEKIFIGHDYGITKVNFNGSGEASIATTISSVMFNVPRPSAQFLGKMYFGNGNNIMEVDSTETVTSYAKLSPGFPAGTYIRDLDVSSDGNYLEITVSRANSQSWFQASSENSFANVDSYKFYWNGSDTGYTALQNYPGYSLTSNVTFGELSYTLGSDMNGSAIYDKNSKIITLVGVNPPNFHAIFSNSNLLGFVSNEYVSSVAQMQVSAMMYGQYDKENKTGLFRLLRNPAGASVGAGVYNNVVSTPVALPVTNFSYGFGNYSGSVMGVGKIYFSTTEFSPDGFTRFRTYDFLTTPIGTRSVLGGVWESQNEVFSKKVKPTEVRLYTEPLTTSDISFKLDLVNTISSVLASQTFTAGTSPVSLNDDHVWWNPQVSPGTSWGLRITNLGSKNWVGLKAEIDFVESGK